MVLCILNFSLICCNIDTNISTTLSEKIHDIDIQNFSYYIWQPKESFNSFHYSLLTYVMAIQLVQYLNEPYFEIGCWWTRQQHKSKYTKWPSNQTYTISTFFVWTSSLLSNYQSELVAHWFESVSSKLHLPTLWFCSPILGG